MEVQENALSDVRISGQAIMFHRDFFVLIIDCSVILALHFGMHYTNWCVTRGNLLIGNEDYVIVPSYQLACI